MPLTRRLIIVSSTILLALLPFQTLITVWLATNFGHLYFWTAWKELLVAVISICGVIILINDRVIRKKFLSKTYNKIAIAYLLLGGIYLLVQRLDFSALVGFAIDFRYILIFLSLQLVELNKKQITQMLVVIGSILGTLAIIQLLVLPPSFLTFFGYDKPGINTSGIPPAYHSVASGSSLNRAQATLRGPNELGAYLILSTFLGAFAYVKTKKKLFLGAGALSVAGLLLSYSRSAWIGIIVALVAYVVISRSKKGIKLNKQLVVAGIAAFALLGVIGWRTNTIQTVVLHHNPEVTTVQSNQGHIDLSIQATEDIAYKPLGYGLGQAGPSSALDNPKEAKISENYFLQVGLEMGVIGMALFLALHLYVLKELYLLRNTKYGYPILLTFIALIVTNMLLHTWADEAVAITVWAVVAMQLSLSRVKSKSSE